MYVSNSVWFVVALGRVGGLATAYFPLPIVWWNNATVELTMGGDVNREGWRVESRLGVSIS